jgi:deoxyribose-phosphate aldolase
MDHFGIAGANIKPFFGMNKYFEQIFSKKSHINTYICTFHFMLIKNYLDATYLKLPEQAGLNADENDQVVFAFIKEAIAFDFKAVMIRPQYVAVAKKMIEEAHSKVQIGTVIGFHEGTMSTEEKLLEAEQAITDGADDLDFVCNFQAFQTGQIDLVKREVLAGTHLALSHHKVIKWIIEVAALNPLQIVQLSALIKNVFFANFNETLCHQVFVKSSTGFYQTTNNKPNGATTDSIKLMLENAYPLPVKAAGGVRNYHEAMAMINLGVKRIGTSAAKDIVLGLENHQAY